MEVVVSEADLERLYPQEVDIIRQRFGDDLSKTLAELPQSSLIGMHDATEDDHRSSRLWDLRKELELVN